MHNISNFDVFSIFFQTYFLYISSTLVFFFFFSVFYHNRNSSYYWNQIKESFFDKIIYIIFFPFYKFYFFFPKIKNKLFWIIFDYYFHSSNKYFFQSSKDFGYYLNPRHDYWICLLNKRENLFKDNFIHYTF